MQGFNASSKGYRHQAYSFMSRHRVNCVISHALHQLTKSQATKGTSVFSRPAQSQHIPQMLDSANKGCADIEKTVVVIQDQQRREWDLKRRRGVSMQISEEVKRRAWGGGGQRWWPRLMGGWQITPPESIRATGRWITHWDIWKSTLWVDEAVYPPLSYLLIIVAYWVTGLTWAARIVLCALGLSQQPK